MVAVSPLSGSNLPIRVGDTLNIGLRPAAPGTPPSTASAAKTLTAKQGAEAVGKALGNATEAFAALSGLQEQIKAATRPGATLGKEEAQALNDRIKEVKAKVDKLAADAKVGEANLLSDSQRSVSVATASGLKVNIATQSLDSKALGLDDIDVTDADSLRKATGRVAQAVGQTQLAVFRLQTADGATGAPAPSGPGVSAYEKIAASLAATPEPGSAAASLEKALANQAAANATSYGSSGGFGASATPAPSILSLFT
ncbi:hypothetical protein [Magnetospirillum sp. SS-4]|uniref:hypothetical protein n=1 Tax=Magnetospirillum sp. SS-4 TaxID=2681465 RepID=UPI00138212BD|nr:hypothetical protein [Magnetospirillum sp. SS-4]CAA7627512.1 hypothetical protein MTBSS4_90047 [Magnetospirillum sp. SS-4]